MNFIVASMMDRVDESVGYYLRFYRRFAIDTWKNMTPMQYGCLLIGIGVFGYILMKTSLTKA